MNYFFGGGGEAALLRGYGCSLFSLKSLNWTFLNLEFRKNALIISWKSVDGPMWKKLLKLKNVAYFIKRKSFETL